MTERTDHAGDERQQRIIDRIAQDARVIEEARMLPFEGELTQEQIDLAIDRINAYIARKDIDVELVSRQAGRSPVSITQFLSKKWNGDEAKFARQLTTWMEQHARGESSGMPQGFISTGITRRMYGLMSAVHRTRTVGLITGPAGVSKSVMCRAAESGLFVGSVHLECTQGCRSPVQFAKIWARRLGSMASGPMGAVEDGIIRALKGTDRLQMIDEAFYLSNEGLNVVRDVHKQAKVPVVLIGTRDVEDRTDDKRQWYGQWSRLISYRYDILESQEMDGEPLFTVDDIHRFAGSMQLKLTGDGAESATEIACIPGEGGLGIVAMILLNAKILCEREGRAKINKHDIIGAYESMQGRRWTERLEVTRHALLERVKVA